MRLSHDCIIIIHLLESSVMALGQHIIIHANNDKSHVSQNGQKSLGETRVIRTSHPLYAPDLPPPHLFLFGDIKSQLEGQVFLSRR
jgi:hypothetical protein